MAKAATLQPAHAPSSLRRYIPAILLGAALLVEDHAPRQAAVPTRPVQHIDPDKD